MQKILVLILTIISSGLVNTGFAADCTGETAGECSGPIQAADPASSTSSSTSSSGPMKIFTSEAVPGADCKCISDNGNTANQYNTTPGSQQSQMLAEQDGGGIQNGESGVSCKGPVEKRKYECTVPTGLAGFQSVFAKLIRFVINIVLLLGVLAVVGLGIAWSFAGGDDIKAKSSLKKWAINIIIGLAILFFFRYILAFLAPWVYQ